MKSLAVCMLVVGLGGWMPGAQSRDIGLTLQVVHPGITGVVQVGRPRPVTPPVWAEPAWVAEPWCEEPYPHRHVHRPGYRGDRREVVVIYPRRHQRAYHGHPDRHAERYPHRHLHRHAKHHHPRWD